MPVPMTVAMQIRTVYIYIYICMYHSSCLQQVTRCCDIPYNIYRTEWTDQKGTLFFKMVMSFTNSNTPSTNITWSQRVCMCRSLLCMQDQSRVWRHSSRTAPVFVSVCVWVCACECVCCALANLHGDSIPRLWLSTVAVLGCHFSSFASYWDSRAEGSVWAARRLKEVLLLNDTRLHAEECAPVRFPLSSIGKPGSLAHKKNNTAVRTSPVPSPPWHFWANIQRDGAEDAGLLEYIHIDKFAYMHSSTARNVQAKRER